MKNNQDRVLTVRLTIKDPEAAKWLWEAHPEPRNGVIVSALADGDLFHERDVLADAACFYIQEEGETTEDAIEAALGDPFNCPDEAARSASKMYDSKVKWNIIDFRGNVVRSSA